MALDLFHLPDEAGSYYKRFTGNSGATRSWLTWEKPRGLKWFRFFIVGGGAGGTSGFPSATTTARGGGGGGGSGSITQALIPACVLPEELFLSPGLGGAGGASSTSVSNPGTAGQASYVGVRPDTGAIYTVAFANGGGAGAAATAAAAGTAGAAGAVATRAAMLLSGYGHIDFIAGGAGGAGGPINGVGVSSTYPTNGCLFSGGGGGGGGAGLSGGNASAPASQLTSRILIATRFAALSSGTLGQDGYQSSDPFNGPLLSIGGGGGGSDSGSTAAGSAGGRGGPGSGGGGGGAGGTTGGGGPGGPGGPGYIEIWGF